MSRSRAQPGSGPRGLPVGRPGSGRARGNSRVLRGVALLGGIVAVMWLVEIVNTLDGNRLDGDGIWPRNVGRLWGILTSPFVHASFAHLIGNTLPLVFMGVLIAVRGAARMALLSALVIVIGGLGTWLIAPANHPTIGASGLVFGYATYLVTRGVFNRSLLDLATAVVVGVVWGGALLGSLVPHPGISWQGHLCGGAAGVVAAWLLARREPGGRPRPRPVQARIRV